MAFEAGVVTREDAQRRVDRIRAFRDELAELERLGVVALDTGQQDRLRRFHDEAVASLAARFDVDSTEAERRLSLGMRTASLLGAIALSAAVYFFFYRFWGSFSTGVQLVVLATAPLVAVGAMELAARKERTLYVAGILGLVAVVCFVLDLNVLGATFNVEPAPGAFLAWSAFAGLLAYAYGLHLLLLVAIVGFTVFLSSQVAVWTGYPLNLSLQRPESLLLPGVLLLVMAAFVPSRGLPRFPLFYRVSGLIVLLFALLVLSNWGWNSYLPWPWGAVEIGYQVVGFAVAGLAIAVGNRRGWREVETVGTAFFALFLFARFFDWWWDWMPRWLFFLVIGTLAVAILLALRRLRSTGHRVTA